MSNDFARRAADLLSVACILGLAAYGIFWLPYSFPPTEITNSASFDLGFNNRLSVLAVLAAIGLLCVRNVFWRQTIAPPVETLFRLPAEAGRWGTVPIFASAKMGLSPLPRRQCLGMPKVILLFFMGLYVAVSVLLYLALPRLGGWCEPASYLPRLELSWRYHLQLYSEIDWAYGPALFYVPVAFIAVGRRLGADPDLSYLICFLCASLAGLWVAFYVVDNFRIKMARRVLVYSVIALCFCTVSLGINATLLRFAAPYAAILVLHGAAQRTAPLRSLAAVLKICGLSFACALAVMSISIELGLAYAVAQSAYAVHRVVFGDRSWLWAILATVAAPLVLLSMFPDCLRVLEGFSRGGNNLPVVPGVHIVMYLLTLFWVVPLLLAACATRRPGVNVPLLLAWALLAIATISPALGLCEFTHVLDNGIGVFLLALAFLARYRPRLFPMYAVLFVAVFGAICQIVSLSYAAAGGQTEPLLRALTAAPVVSDSGPSPLVADLRLEDYTAVAIPFGADVPTRRWLVETGRFSPQHHPDYVNVLSLANLADKIKGLSKADAVLAPEWVASLQRMSDEEFRRGREQQAAAYDRLKGRMTGLLLLYPVSYQSRQFPFMLQLAEAQYIAAKYQTVRTARGWAIMTPRKP
jgi:hypothetical protein